MMKKEAQKKDGRIRKKIKCRLVHNDEKEGERKEGCIED